MKYTKEFKVGLFAIVMIAGLYIGFNYLKGIDFFSDTKKYYVLYNNVGGLNISNPVSINGFKVGTVSDIEILQRNNNQILVELSLKGDIVVGKNAVATLDSDFLGAMSIVIGAGDITEPALPLDTIRGALDRGIQDILKDSALPVADNLQATIQKLNTFLDTLNGNGENLHLAIENLKKTTNQSNILMYETRKNLSTVLGNMNNTMSSLNERITELKPTIQKYGALADSLKSLNIQPTIDKLGATVDSLQQAVNAINTADGTLGKLIRNDSLYNNMNSTFENLDKLMIHINENPKHFFGPLGKSKKKIEKEKRKEAKKQGD